MNRFGYNLISLGLFPLFLVFILFRLFSKAGFSKGINQRFGLFSTSSMNNPIWLHCVSVGEANAAMPLIKELGERHGYDNLLVTGTTVTGMQILNDRLDKNIHRCFLPYDFWFFIYPFVRRVKPRILVVMETELWPNLLHSCAVNQCPILLANARLSERSYLRYARFPRLAQQMMADVNQIIAVSDNDGQRFVKIGLDPTRLITASNIKSDIQFSQAQQDTIRTLRRAITDNRQVVVAGSTHPGEEEVILAAFQSCLAEHPSALLILAPRQPQRRQDIVNLTEKRGLSQQCRSEANIPSADTQVFIVDTLGELVLFFGAANIAFIGGSLFELGGHNPLEPAALAVPVLSGQSVFAFEQPYKLLVEHGGAVLVADQQELTHQLQRLLSHPEQAIEMGANAQSCQVKQCGSIDVHITAINALMKK